MTWRTVTKTSRPLPPCFSVTARMVLVRVTRSPGRSVPVKREPAARPHAARQVVHRRQEAAAPGVPVGAELVGRHPVLEQHPMPKRRQRVGHGDAERRRKALDQARPDLVGAGFRLADEVVVAHRRSKDCGTGGVNPAGCHRLSAAPALASAGVAARGRAAGAGRPRPPMARCPARFGCRPSPGPPSVLSGTNSARSAPVCASSVALSKSITPSNRPALLRIAVVQRLALLLDLRGR